MSIRRWLLRFICHCSSLDLTNTMTPIPFDIKPMLRTHTSFYHYSICVPTNTPIPGTHLAVVSYYVIIQCGPLVFFFMFSFAFISYQMKCRWFASIHHFNEFKWKTHEWKQLCRTRTQWIAITCPFWIFVANTLRWPIIAQHNLLPASDNQPVSMKMENGNIVCSFDLLHPH